MDSVEQAEGEKRVMRLLVEPLKRRGLAKPSALTMAGFDDMVRDMCARLAYMSDDSLAALEEQVASCPGGKEKDRFPIANVILTWAADIQPPGDSASPLIRAVFAHQVGEAALSEGWAPELLFDLRKNRRWPGAWPLKTIKEGAGDTIRKLRDIEARLSRGETISETEADWRDRRVAALRRCEDIAAVSKVGDGGNAA